MPHLPELAPAEEAAPVDPAPAPVAVKPARVQKQPKNRTFLVAGGVALGTGVRAKVLNTYFPVDQVELEPASVGVLGVQRGDRRSRVDDR